MSARWGYQKDPWMVPFHNFTPDPHEPALCGRCGHHKDYIKHVDGPVYVVGPLIRARRKRWVT